MKRKSHVFAAISAFALALFGCDASSTPTVTGQFSVTALDVGKADALILKTTNHALVLDTGNKGDGKDIEKYLEKNGISKLDALIITHFDKDHVGGAARLVNRMEIEKIYLPDYTGTTEEYAAFQEKLAESSVTPDIIPMNSETSWVFDDVSFSLESAHKDYYGKNEENDFSLCLYAKHGANGFLFTGDAEEQRQTEIIAKKYEDVKFLKFPYHGNYLSTTEALLDAYTPEFVLVCCSKKEYAQDQTVITLADRGISAHYTPDGPITYLSDGNKVSATDS